MSERTVTWRVERGLTRWVAEQGCDRFTSTRGSCSEYDADPSNWCLPCQVGALLGDNESANGSQSWTADWVKYDRTSFLAGYAACLEKLGITEETVSKLRGAGHFIHALALTSRFVGAGGDPRAAAADAKTFCCALADRLSAALKEGAGK